MFGTLSIYKEAININYTRQHFGKKLKQHYNVER